MKYRLKMKFSSPCGQPVPPEVCRNNWYEFDPIVHLGLIGGFTDLKDPLNGVFARGVPKTETY